MVQNIRQHPFLIHAGSVSTICVRFLFFLGTYLVAMGDDLQPGCLADRLLTGLGQPQINQ